MDFDNYNWALALPQEFASATDFKAEATIELDTSIKLPKSFSLWEWIYSTNYQWNYGSCTANATSHGIQVLEVKSKGKKPETNNIITPSWRDLWTKMGHDLKDVNDSWDYVEKAVTTALKNWISNEEWGISTFDGYAVGQWEETNKGIEMIKRYIYNGNPVVWLLRGNSITWTELSQWQLKTIVKSEERNWGHAVACVGWDEWGLWFVNSRRTNDWKWLKSRFYVTYEVMKNAKWTFNWRYWLPFKKEQAIKSPEYIKRKNIYIAVLGALKKTYPQETAEMQQAIEQFSQICRKSYEEINKELPING